MSNYKDYKWFKCDGIGFYVGKKYHMVTEKGFDAAFHKTVSFVGVEIGILSAIYLCFEDEYGRVVMILLHELPDYKWAEIPGQPPISKA